jgi:hypothetical protein
MANPFLITEQELKDFLEINEALVRYMNGEKHIVEELAKSFGREKIVAYTIAHFSQVYATPTNGISSLQRTDLFDKSS